MQAKSKLPSWERKEGLMIRELAQIIFRQVCTPPERLPEEPPRPLVPSAIDFPTPSAEEASAQIDAMSMTLAQGEEIRGLQEQALALVVLFTQLAQRRVQAARAQEGTHEYGSHHHDPPRANGVRLREAINRVAGE